MVNRSKSQGGDLKINPDWVPPTDPVFAYLLREAVSGSGAVLVYYAAIPLVRVVRYEPSFHPEDTEHGDAVVQSIMDDWRQGKFAKVWVYPKGDLFVLSDDYFTLAAAERGKADFLPCRVLGRPSETVAKDIQGPIAPEGLRKMLGMA
jgi:hypothetical protein